ncbi:MAG: 5-(carboxyamino)imidazole ribonucleotide mutase [Gemmatimonadetes bacterium]|nr:MAG: 5-(carboxyamino)imidazole ribonucleotide mutase [Gemmatimonadota bacterium]
MADDPPRDAAAHRRRRLRAAPAAPGLQRDRRGGLSVADVLIVVGSESDKPRIEPAFEVLSKAGVSYEFHVSSAHRHPDQTADLVKGARKKGFRVVIAGAGLSAALPGFAASVTDLPVIGVPFAAGPLNGLDALLATAQVPGGVPVACVGIDNATNAALLAVRILKA